MYYMPGGKKSYLFLQPIIIFMAVLFLAVLFAPSLPGRTLDLVQNGNFEEWIEGIPEHWGGKKTSFTPENIHQFTEDPHSGNYAIQLINTDEEGLIFSSRDIPVESGEEYVISWLARGKGIITAGIHDLDFQMSGEFVIDSEDWTEYTAVITAQNSQPDAELVFSVKNTEADSDHLQLDSVSLQFDTEFDMSLIPGWFGTLQVIGIFGVFFVFLVLMFLKKVAALFALPLMAFCFTIIGGGGYLFLLDDSQGVLMHVVVLLLIIAGLIFFIKKVKVPPVFSVLSFIILAILAFFFIDNEVWELIYYIYKDVGHVIHEGSFRLHQAYVVAMFGGMLAIFIKEKRIAERIIKFAAELAGDNPFLMSMFLLVVNSILFSVLGGLGAIIMVGTIILPIMISIGAPPTVAGGIFLIGMAAGGSLNPSMWEIYIQTMGIEREMIRNYAIAIYSLYLIIGFLFITTQLRKKASYSADIQLPKFEKKGSFLPMLTPLVPICLAIIGFPFILAFCLGILYGYVTAYEKGDFKILGKAIIKGTESVMPAVVLMFGIGMLLVATANPMVSAPIQPLFEHLAGLNRFTYVIVFTILTPLALYRGPLNLWGLGAGLASILLATQAFPNPALVMGIFISVGAVQGVCDPTNTHNVWIANFIGCDVLELTKKTIPYIWFLSFLGLTIASISYY